MYCTLLGCATSPTDRPDSAVWDSPRMCNNTEKGGTYSTTRHKEALKMPRNAATKRPVGRPKADRPAIGAAEDASIRRLWLHGWGFRAIGRAVGLADTTVARHVRAVIEPEWTEQRRLSAGADLERVAALERLAWSRLESGDTGNLDELRKAVGRSKKRTLILEALIERAAGSNDANVWLATIRWAVEFRAKVGNYFAARDDGQGGEFRRAGQNEKSLAEQAVERLEAALAVKRASRQVQ